LQIRKGNTMRQALKKLLQKLGLMKKTRRYYGHFQNQGISAVISIWYLDDDLHLRHLATKVVDRTGMNEAKQTEVAMSMLYERGFCKFELEIF